MKKKNIITNAGGEFTLKVNHIPKENRNEASIKIKPGSIEKLLHFPILNSDIDVQFLPEGGNLVNDIENNVAFIVIDGYGCGKDVRGYLQDNKGRVVSGFKSTHYGMGKFSFIPESVASYVSYIQTSRKTLSYPLYSTDNYAYQLSIIKRSEEAVKIRVALGDSL